MYAPDSAPFAFTSGPGALTGTYYYKVTFVTNTGTETSPGPSSVGVSPVNQEVLVDDILTSSNSAVTERKLYRTKAGESLAGPYYLVTTIYDDSTASYFDDTPDSSLVVFAP